MRKKCKYVLLVCSLVFIFVGFMQAAYAQGNIVRLNTDENSLGFIYFDYSPTIYASVSNEEAGEKVITIVSKAEDESGVVVWSDTLDVTIPHYTVLSIPIQPDIKKFGIYTLNLTVDGKTIKQKFSIANRPRDGSVSQWCMINDHTIKGHGAKESSRKIELLYKAGFGGIRQEYLWESFEPVLGNFKVPEKVASIIKLVNTYSMDILGIMMGCPKYLSEWNNGTLPVTEETLTEWSKYAEHTATKTKDVSTYYEVWNEYNMRAGAEPDNYIKLLKASYEALHKNPNAVVCGFAAANIGENQSEYKYSALEWIEKVLSGGGGEYMDAVSIHCYTNSTPEDDLSTLKNGKTWLIDETRAILDKYGYTDMPIIVSEMGWSTGATDHTEIEKAQYMIRYSAMNYGKIDRLYWYVSQDKQNYDGSGNLDLYENELGIINTWDNSTGCENPYAAKPAFLALSNFNAMMNGALATEKCETEEDVYQYKFSDRNNDSLYIAWSISKESKETEIQSGGKCVTVYDIYGNVVKSDTSGDLVKVELGKSPVYIKLTEKQENNSEYYPQVLVDYKTGEVKISGTVAYPAESATIAMIKKNIDTITTSDVAYIGQSKMSQNGKYRFEFILNDINGLYTTNIGFRGKNKTQSVGRQFDIAIPNISVLSKNGSAIKSVSQLSNGDEIFVKLDGVRGLTADSNTVLFAVVYTQESIADVKTENLGTGSKSAELKLTVDKVSEIDKIKIFFWKKGNIEPLIGVYEID